MHTHKNDYMGSLLHLVALNCNLLGDRGDGSCGGLRGHSQIFPDGLLLDIR